MKGKHFFEVDHRVQLRPKALYLSRKSCFSGLHATIKRIERRPDPNFYVDPNDWYRGPHWTLFWVEVDDHPECGEIPFKYTDLRLLQATFHA